MRRKARDPIVVAIALFVLLMIVLFLYLASFAIDQYAKKRQAPPALWAPPGWVGPTTPPPSPHLNE